MPSSLTAHDALRVLNSLPEIGPVTIRRLLGAFGDDPVAVLEADSAAWRSVRGVGPKMVAMLGKWRDEVDLEADDRLQREHEVRFVSQVDADFPALLRETYDCPAGLYVKGDFTFNRPLVAIVGTRHPTHYGRRAARLLAGGLARAGYGVVSGMARGTDAEAHQAVLAEEGLTVAVMGCGIDLIYPPEHAELHARIARTGAVISEFPFGRPADRTTFPMRNRLVSGLCRAVIVVESDEKGGSMITARFAAEQNRTVFALPGQIDQPTSRGCHLLIRDGAILVRGVDDVLEELQATSQRDLPLFDGGSNARAPEAVLPELSSNEERVLRALGDGSLHFPDTLAALTDLPVTQVTTSLLLLEMKKAVAKRVDGRFEGLVRLPEPTAVTEWPEA